MKIILTDPAFVLALRDYLRARGCIAHLVPGDALALEALLPGATRAQEHADLPALVVEWQDGRVDRRAIFEG